MIRIINETFIKKIIDLLPPLEENMKYEIQLWDNPLEIGVELIIVFSDGISLNFDSTTNMLLSKLILEHEGYKKAEFENMNQFQLRRQKV